MENNIQNEPQKKSLMPVVIISAIVVLAVAGAYLFFSQNNTSGVLTENQEPQNNEQNISNNETEAARYNMSEVATHNSETDCWLVIEGKVYNVTSFIPNHPGGKAILAGCGKDATVLFNERPTNDKGPHPEQARELLATFYIGELEMGK